MGGVTDELALLPWFDNKPGLTLPENPEEEKYVDAMRCGPENRDLIVRAI